MVAALSTVVVLLLIGAATIHLAYLEKMISRRYVEYLQASYLAESGIESARAAMFNDPGVLSSPETTFHLEIVQPDLVGSAVITVTQPLFDGLLIVKSTGQTSGGAKRIWQADMTAPPGYEVYCEKFSLNPELDISFILQTFGINHPESGRPLQGHCKSIRAVGRLARSWMQKALFRAATPAAISLRTRRYEVLVPSRGVRRAQLGRLQLPL